MPDQNRTSPIEHGLDDAIALTTWLRDLERDSGAITTIADHLAGCLAAGGRLLTCGNGGSLCDAMHFAEELSGRFRDDRPAIAAQSMGDATHLTCVANDYDFERVFARGRSVGQGRRRACRVLHVGQESEPDCRG